MRKGNATTIKRWWKLKGRNQAYSSQIVQDTFFDTSLFEIDSGAIDHIGDDLLINLPDLSIRHLDGGLKGWSWLMKESVVCTWCCARQIITSPSLQSQTLNLSGQYNDLIKARSRQCIDKAWEGRRCSQIVVVEGRSGCWRTSEPFVGSIATTSALVNPSEFVDSVNWPSSILIMWYNDIFLFWYWNWTLIVLGYGVVWGRRLSLGVGSENPLVSARELRLDAY